MAGSLNVDLLVPDETELALLGGLETLFECDVKNDCRNKGGNGYEICTSAQRKRTDCIRFRLRHRRPHGRI